MIIEFNPRITGAFVEYIIKNPTLKDDISELKACNWTDEEIHNFIKKVMIASFKKLNVNINDDINKAKEEIKRQSSSHVLETDGR